MKRRDFIKFSALAATAAQASRIEGVTQTIFDNKKVFGANRFGLFWANTNSNQIVSVSDFEGDKFPNTMNYSLPDSVQNEARVLYPMVRKSYLKAKGAAKSELRGKEEFVRVSWDVALDLAAKALKEAHEKYGSEAIYGECYWWGGSGKVSWGRTVAHRMLKILGGYVEESGDYSTGAGLVIMPHVLGSSAVYDTPTKWAAIVKNAKNVVFWATDPIVTNQISSVPPTHEGYVGIKELKKSGIKTYSVNAMINDTARYFGSENIIVRPNTDAALIIGMCHHLFTSKLYDEEFIKKYTVGFNKFKDYFMGETDKVVKDAEWASKICGVAADKIKSFAEALAKEPTTVLIGRALQRADHGEQPFWALIALNAMLGYIGKEGLGFEFSLGYDSGGMTNKISPTLKGISTRISEKYENLGKAPWKDAKNVTIPSSRSIEALEYPGKEIDYDGTKIKLPRMRVAYMASGSMFTRHQDVNNIVKQWRKFDTVITAEPYWTSTAKFSDIVLPVAIEVERNDINQTGDSGEYIVAYKPVIAPMGESKSDFWICEQICKRWGYGEAFSEGKDELGWMKEFYADAAEQAKGLNLSMPSFEEFYEKGFVRFEKDDENNALYTRLAAFRENPAKNRLGTPSGKIEIYSPTIAKMNYADCPPMPTWIEPKEWLGNATKKYPLHVVSPHSRYRLHSQLNNSIIRNFAEVSGREPVLINPKDAKERGLATGDVARVFNDRGEILAGVLVTDIVPERVVAICEGAWYDPEIWGEKSLCQHGCVNVLTFDKGTSSLAQSNSAHTVLAQIEKFKGEIKPIQAFSKPKILQSL